MEGLYITLAIVSVPLSFIAGTFYLLKNFTLSKHQRKQLMEKIEEVKEDNLKLQKRIEVLEGVAISLSDGVVTPAEEEQFQELKQTVQRSAYVTSKR